MCQPQVKADDVGRVLWLLCGVTLPTDGDRLARYCLGPVVYVIHPQWCCSSPLLFLVSGHSYSSRVHHTHQGYMGVHPLPKLVGNVP
jgi:hypothetical protein